MVTLQKNKYRITYTRNGVKKSVIRYALLARYAVEDYARSHGWGYHAEQYDSDTSGEQWAEYTCYPPESRYNGIYVSCEKVG